jgi:hypothetical protein
MITSWKKKWIKALRSGQYEQTTGELKNFQGYCCLGVLREIMDPSDASESKGGDLLSTKQLAKCGLDSRRQEFLAELNDGGSTFEEIADYVEKRVKG